MSRAGQTTYNKITGERILIVTGTEDNAEGDLVADLYIAPGGAVVGEHVHPNIEERFTVLSGKVGFRINGVEQIAPLNTELVVTPGIAHDWWNAGDEEAYVRVEIRPGVRFELMAQNLFGLANDGKTNAKGMPNPLQLAIFGREFQDVLYFTSPPRWVQKLMFAVLAPVARLAGYQGTYLKYTHPDEQTTAELFTPDAINANAGTTVAVVEA
jgi:quercetin dioxygenase-like cupin family protein